MTGERMDENVDVSEVYQQMDELGRAKFDAALAQVQLRRTTKRIAELENQQAENENQIAAKVAAQNGKTPVGSGRA
jgi:hypothetical protein